MNLNGEYDFRIKRKRPEEEYEKVSDYFRGNILIQYANSKSMMRIQEKITKRALELLNLKKKDVLILDAGCGPGFAAVYLKELGYEIVALDIISEFLHVHDIKDLNPINADMCFPPFKPNTFDGIVSISALQWVFRDINNKLMHLMIKNLFKSFFKILKPNCRVIVQFYPKKNELMKRIGKIITDHTDFKGNFIVDNPNRPKKRKIFLLLSKQAK